MGLFSDAVEAEVGRRHYGVRATATLLGGRVSLYVDGRKRDWGQVYFFGRRLTLSTLVDGQLVCLQVKAGLAGTQYRLFVGDDEVALHIEPGESSFTTLVQAPRLQHTALPRLPDSHHEP